MATISCALDPAEAVSTTAHFVVGCASQPQAGHAVPHVYGIADTLGWLIVLAIFAMFFITTRSPPAPRK